MSIFLTGFPQFEDVASQLRLARYYYLTRAECLLGIAFAFTMISGLIPFFVNGISGLRNKIPHVPFCADTLYFYKG